ncbi:hypothetical protein GCM10022261_15340 [Brevibacterium daeguense]|uniref:Uncharacterized protein n=1 Tax=Brevibacterium daeguense TaxID=909936 RepID=A0ABP8EJ77_9MICO|nr:hypothetical protein [Brevibacterium daeguense]
MTDIVLDDAHAFADWRVLTNRAARLDPDGAMRVSVFGTVLVLTVSPLHPHGIGDETPLELGMRMLALPQSEHDGLDAVVPLAAIADRFARAEALGTLTMPLPPQEVRAAWAGVAPPRGPWELLGSLPAADFTRTAEAGIAEVAAGTPSGAGSAAVAALRRRVWSRPMEFGSVFDAVSPAPNAGASFALHGLGFLASADRVEVRRSDQWLRMSTAAGHVLTRSTR